MYLQHTAICISTLKREKDKMEHGEWWKTGGEVKNILTGFELKSSMMLPKRSGEAKSTDKLKEKDFDSPLPL